MAEGKTITIIQKGKTVTKQKIHVTADAFCFYGSTGSGNGIVDAYVYLKDESGKNFNAPEDLTFSQVCCCWNYPFEGNVVTTTVYVSKGDYRGIGRAYNGVDNCGEVPKEAWILGAMPTSDTYEYVNDTVDPR